MDSGVSKTVVRNRSSRIAAKRSRRQNSSARPSEPDDESGCYVSTVAKSKTSNNVINAYDRNRCITPLPENVFIGSSTFPQINAYLLCKICKNVLKDTTVVRECMHRFCASCIGNQLKSGLNQCPVCGISVVKRGALMSDKLFDSIILQFSSYRNRKAIIKPLTELVKSRKVHTEGMQSSSNSNFVEAQSTTNEAPSTSSEHFPAPKAESLGSDVGLVVDEDDRERAGVNCLSQGVSQAKASSDHHSLKPSAVRSERVADEAPVVVDKDGKDKLATDSVDTLLHEKQRIRGDIETQIILYPDSKVLKLGEAAHRARFIDVPVGTVVGHLREFLMKRLEVELNDYKLHEKYAINIYPIKTDLPIEQILVVCKKNTGQFVEMNFKEPNTDHGVSGAMMIGSRPSALSDSTSIESLKEAYWPCKNRPLRLLFNIDLIKASDENDGNLN